MSRWRDSIFDLYGALVDIRTDERPPRLWEAMARWYRERGADYGPEPLRDRYFGAVRALERMDLARVGRILTGMGRDREKVYIIFLPPRGWTGAGPSPRLFPLASRRSRSAKTPVSRGRDPIRNKTRLPWL